MALYQFKVTGRTTASTDGTATGLIGTVSLDIDANGLATFTDSDSNPRAFQIEGDLGRFIKEIFTGTGGFDAGSAGVQGHRVFGQPVLKQ